jgi:hypothetical protein
MVDSCQRLFFLEPLRLTEALAKPDAFIFFMALRPPKYN